MLVAGIIVFAAGMRLATQDAGAPLSEAPRLGLTGGVGLYLAGHAAFRWRIVNSISYEKLVAAGAVLVLFALGGGLSAWSVAMAVSVVVTALCAGETSRNRPAPEAAGDLRLGSSRLE